MTRRTGVTARPEVGLTGPLGGVWAGVCSRHGSAPLLDADGAAVVLHAGPDDYKTDPSGNSGARIACGALVATG